MSEYSLGIDTSNYKTSLAIVDNEGNIFYDDRIPLNVNAGERGLRQQEALFQHVNNLPILIEDALSYVNMKDIKIISASDRPRDNEESYMPCFNGGLSAGRILAASYNIPFKTFSHQDGHIEAGRFYSPLKEKNRFIAFHFSGGTTEALLYDNSRIEIIGGTKDISFGQLIDRVGVAMGLNFPAGEEIDNGALRAGSGSTIYQYGKEILKSSVIVAGSKKYLRDMVPNIKVDSTYINLSGIETAVLRWVERRVDLDDEIRDLMSLALLTEIGDSILKLMELLTEEYGIKDYLFVGGVSASSYIRSYIENYGCEIGFSINFSSPELASDNAIGISILGGKEIWR